MAQVDLYKRTKGHVAPVIELPGSSIWQGASTKDVVDQGTFTFVEWDKRVWAVTNAHVIEARRDRAGDIPSVLSVALDRWRPIPGKLRYLGGAGCPRARYDLAIIEWQDPSALKRANKTPLLLSEHVDLPDPDEIVLSVGYPGHLRTEATPDTASHGLMHIIGTVRSSVADNIVIRDSLPGLDPTMSVGGISGGPVLRLFEAGYEIVAITYEGIGPGDTGGAVYTDDMLSSCAIPFDGAMLDHCITTGCR